MLLLTIDTTLVDAAKAFADCSDGTDSACNNGFEAILADLASTSKNLEVAPAECVHEGRGDYKTCAATL